MDQIGFQESLNQSKLKNCKRTKPLGYLWRKKKGERDLDRGGGWWRRWEEEEEEEEEEGEGESKPRLFLGNTSVKCHSINYWMIEGNLTVFAAIQQERGGYNG